MWKVVVAVVLLAGCASQPQESVDETPHVVTDPTDYSYLDQEQDGEGYHVHDYWNGAENLTLLDDRQECMGCISSSSGDDAAVTMARMRPAGGSVVPQGTRWVHVEASFDVTGAESDYGDVELWVRTSADAQAKRVDVVEGEAITMEVENRQNDPPHNQLSGWRFELRARPADGDQVVVQDWWVELSVVVQRGWDIEPWPPHPDHWGDAWEKEIFTHTNAVTLETHTGSSQNCVGGCFSRPLAVADGIIIPASADRVEIVLEHDAGVPLPFKLRYHAGDTWESTELSPTEATALRSVFVIDVDYSVADGPYSLQTVWEFAVASDLEPPYAYSGTYTATGMMYRE